MDCNGDQAAQEPEADAAKMIDDLVNRAKAILAELEVFRDRLRDLRQDGTVEIAHFRGTVQSELSMLERLSTKAEDHTTFHVARSSNVSFLETVWSTAKKSDGITALLKRVYPSYDSNAETNDNPPTGLGRRVRCKRQSKKASKHSAVTIDAITHGGQIWAKISHVTNKRLLFDLAKQGWEVGSSEDDEDDATDGVSEDDDDRDVPLLKMTKELTSGAKYFRIRTRQPAIHLILPRIHLGLTAEIDKIIEDCRRCGAEIFCSNDLQHVPPIETAIETMAPDPITTFSDTLNIDCTILLALVSEFSHAKVTKEPWFHTALQRQVEIEDNENLLPSLLYPALGGHKLVCTEEAAKRMSEIVDTIGTPSEKARASILMGADTAKTQEQLIEEMQQWSAYTVIPNWQLPISVVDQNENDYQSNLSQEAQAASKSMTAINRSVFMYGWTSNQTTITSNRTVVKRIEDDLEKFDNLDDSVWPKIWLCPTARSLVGKEKRNAKKQGQKSEASMRLPDPLRREHQRRNGLDVLSIREGHDVEDLRPDGYPCDEVYAAKIASARDITSQQLLKEGGTEG